MGHVKATGGAMANEVRGKARVPREKAARVMANVLPVRVGSAGRMVRETANVRQGRAGLVIGTCPRKVDLVRTV